jgi:hypothetical protein
MQGVEHQLPIIAKQLYPGLSKEDVQTPLLLDFAKRAR